MISTNALTADGVVAVIVDIVGSRELRDRAAGQDAVREAFRIADELVPARMKLWPTVADEFQAVYSSPEAACAATTIARLALPDGVDMRFGLGLGATSIVEQSESSPPILDGSAWWNARAAIEEAERRGSKSATARSWMRDDAGDSRAMTPGLLLRDHIISSMRPREKRIALALARGQYQSAIAKAEGVSQSAVSQSARRSGANALVSAISEWREVIS